MAVFKLKKRASMRCGDLIFKKGIPVTVTDKDTVSYLKEAHADFFDITDSTVLEKKTEEPKEQKTEMPITPSAPQTPDSNESADSVDDALKALDDEFSDDSDDEEKKPLSDTIKDMSYTAIKEYAKTEYGITIPGNVRSRDAAAAYLLEAVEGE